MSTTAADEPLAHLERLTAGLGTTLVALLTGATNRTQPAKWADGTEPIPTTVATRLLSAGNAWTTIAAQGGDQIARLWFTGANPDLNDRTPVETLRNGLTHEVDASVARFLALNA